MPHWMRDEAMAKGTKNEECCRREVQIIISQEI